MDRAWQQFLDAELKEDYLNRLTGFVESERSKSKQIFPPHAEMFSALELTPFDQVRIVILGQDPYHGPDQAHGLAFSVREGIDIPPSLRNIFKEIQRDLGGTETSSGDLSRWARQGVLLLNAVLTVEAGMAGSHRDKGWEILTDKIIQKLSHEKQNLVFMLWGSYAQAKKPLIDGSRHLVLTAPHPSPLSAHRGFIGCGHFSQANAYLAAHGEEPVQWSK
jgi:uracil-DNA glycosylase